MPSLVMAALALVGSSFATLHGSLSQGSACNPSSLNTTIGAYIVGENDTIFTIAQTVDRGVCDIARYNRMADAVIITVGEELLIPPQVCDPDNSSCLLTPSNATMDCVIGGPHNYVTFPNDTITSIALNKFNITVASLFNTSLGVATVDTVLDEGKTLKIPQCSPSQCIFQPFEFTYGVYKDLAPLYGTTVGQIMALNSQYNHSEGAVGTGAVITLPMNCTLLSSNYTEIS